MYAADTGNFTQQRDVDLGPVGRKLNTIGGRRCRAEVNSFVGAFQLTRFHVEIEYFDKAFSFFGVGTFRVAGYDHGYRSDGGVTGDGGGSTRRNGARSPRRAAPATDGGTDRRWRRTDLDLPFATGGRVVGGAEAKCFLVNLVLCRQLVDPETVGAVVVGHHPVGGVAVTAYRGRPFGAAGRNGVGYHRNVLLHHRTFAIVTTHIDYAVSDLPGAVDLGGGVDVVEIIAAVANGLGHNNGRLGRLLTAAQHRRTACERAAYGIIDKHGLTVFVIHGNTVAVEQHVTLGVSNGGRPLGSFQLTIVKRFGASPAEIETRIVAKIPFRPRRGLLFGT